MANSEIDLDNISDAQLLDAIRKRGDEIMPITSTTREIYKKRLLNESNSNQSLQEDQDDRITITDKEPRHDIIPSNSTEIYAIYIPSPPDSMNFHDLVFNSKNDCLSQMRRHKGARFKSFQNQEDALKFAIYGPAQVGRPAKSQNGGAAMKEERPSPFSTPTPQQYIQFRKTIERGDLKLFNDFVAKNPRYLVSKADTPSILKEGPRYNALHVACINNKHEFCSEILETIGSADFFKLIYPDDTDNCAKRRAGHLLDLYLNTPDKGFNRTPLHYTSAFGFVDCMKVLVSYPNCAKNRADKYNNTAMQLILSRCKAPFAAARTEIEMLLGDHYYVPIFHDEEKLFTSKIAEPMSPNVPLSPPKPEQQLSDSFGCTFSPSYKLHGYAGPMSPQQAKCFYSKWRSPISNSPKTPGRGQNEDMNLEKIGRDLAFDLKVPWKEYWGFLDEFINISSPAGLIKLEAHLRKMLSQVITERNELDNSDFLGIVKLNYDENGCAAAYDKSVSKNSSFSTIGGLCMDLGDLKLNSPLSCGGDLLKLQEYQKSFEEIKSPVETINNNSIHSGSRIDSFEQMNYVLKSTAISSLTISNIFEQLCGNSKVSQFGTAEMENVRDGVCFELETLRNILCRLNVDDDVYFSFVHATLSSKIVENLNNNSTTLTDFDSLLGSFDKMGGTITDSTSRGINYGHFECLCINLAEIAAGYSKNAVIESPTHKCICPWWQEPIATVITKENIKYQKAHTFLSRLFRAEEQTPNEISTIRHLTFSDDASNSSSIEKDTDSFLTVGSSFADSMRTPDEAVSFFIHGSFPSRVDHLVLNAIEKVKIEQDQFPFISQWVDIVSSYSSDDRKSWPSECEKYIEKYIPSPSQFTNVISSTPKLLKKSFYSHFDSTL